MGIFIILPAEAKLGLEINLNLNFYITQENKCPCIRLLPKITMILIKSACLENMSLICDLGLDWDARSIN